MQCEALRKHGDPGTKACYEKLSTSNDLAIKAEGLWGLRDYQNANNAFQAAVKARPKDANLKVRWGRMFNDYSQPGDAEDLFKEALAIDKNNAKALYGMALVASQSFGGDAAELAEKALKADPEHGGGARAAGADRARRQSSREGRRRSQESDR